MKNDNKFSMLSYVRFTYWTSIVLILWGVVTKVLNSGLETWLAFLFFCMIGIVAWAIGR